MELKNKQTELAKFKDLDCDFDFDKDKENGKDDDTSTENFLADSTQKKKEAFPEGGWGWVCVLGRFYTHFLLIGSVSAFGIIYIELIDYFQTSRTETAWVGSLAGGVSMFIGPISGLLTDKIGCRLTTILGAVIASFGIFISWFANGLLFLCFTYGIIGGVGLGLMFIPSAVIVFHYFSRKRGLASAIGSTGGGVGAMVLPLVYDELIQSFGWRGSMWIIAGLVLNAAVCGMVFWTPDQTQKSKVTNKEDIKKSPGFFSVFRNCRFILFFLGTMFCYFGYGVPIVHMPDLAYQKGVARHQVAYLLSIMGITGVVLRVPVAWLSDISKSSRPLILGVALILSGVGTTLCPHMNSFVMFAVYSAVQGGCMGIFGAFLGVIVADIVGLGATNRGIGFLIFSGGFATIISSPLAGWMYDKTESYITSFYFAGAVYFLSGLLTVGVFVLERISRKA